MTILFQILINGSESVEQLCLNFRLRDHQSHVNFLAGFEVRHAALEQILRQSIRIASHRLSNGTNVVRELKGFFSIKGIKLYQLSNLDRYLI